jgi:hypothetical protein
VHEILEVNGRIKKEHKLGIALASGNSYLYKKKEQMVKKNIFDA